MFILVFGLVHAAVDCDWQKNDVRLNCDNPGTSVGRMWTSLGVQCGCTWNDVCTRPHPSGPEHGDTTLFAARVALALESICTEDTPCEPGPSICISGDLGTTFDYLILVWILIPLFCVSALVGIIICAYVGICCWANKHSTPVSF